MPQNAPWRNTAGTAPAPEAAQSESMRIEPSAIPGLVAALQSSLDAVGVQIGHAITELRIQPWAGDPVSTGAAEQFNEHSVGGDQAALDALCGYRDRLQSAAEALQRANTQYQDSDETGAGLLQPGC